MTGTVDPHATSIRAHRSLSGVAPTASPTGGPDAFEQLVFDVVVQVATLGDVIR